MSKEVKELNWSSLHQPYRNVGLQVYWWNIELFELREEAIRTGKYEGTYKHYDQTFLAIYADVNKLLIDGNVLNVNTLLKGLIAHLNSFSKTKGLEGCPIVKDQKNTYEIKFAKEFADRIPRVHKEAKEAVKQHKEMPWVTKQVVTSLLKSSTLTTLLANAEKVKAGLPKSEPTKEESLTL